MTLLQGFRSPCLLCRGEISRASKQVADPQVRDKIQSELAKTLKKMQFPVQEAETTPVTALPKVIMCFQKRLGKLNSLQEELNKLVPEPPSAKASPQEQEKFENSIHRKILFLHASMQSIRFGFGYDGTLSFITPFKYICLSHCI